MAKRLQRLYLKREFEVALNQHFLRCGCILFFGHQQGYKKYDVNRSLFRMKFNQGVKPWIMMKIQFTPKAIEMFFALIIEVVWIMLSNFNGNIGPVWIVSIHKRKCWLQTSCYCQ